MRGVRGPGPDFSLALATGRAQLREPLRGLSQRDWAALVVHPADKLMQSEVSCGGISEYRAAALSVGQHVGQPRMKLPFHTSKTTPGLGLIPIIFFVV